MNSHCIFFIIVNYTYNIFCYFFLKIISVPSIGSLKAEDNATSKNSTKIVLHMAHVNSANKIVI